MLQVGDLKSRSVSRFHDSVMQRLSSPEQRMIFMVSVDELMRGSRHFSSSLSPGLYVRSEELYRAIIAAARSFSDAATGFRTLAEMNSDNESLKVDLLRAAQRAANMENRAATVEAAKRPGLQVSRP